MSANSLSASSEFAPLDSLEWTTADINKLDLGRRRALAKGMLDLLKELDLGSFDTAQASCKNEDPDRFFLTRGKSAFRTIERYCARCPVREACLEFALGHKFHYGVWGGTTGRERERPGETGLKQTRRKAG